jgi:hypothetical protein
MKTFFNIIRGLIAAFLFILCWAFITISFILLPLAGVFKDSNSLNTMLDNSRIELQLIDFFTQIPTPSGEELESIPEIDFSEIITDDVITSVIDLRRDIINEVYSAIESEEALSYEIDIDFLMDLYEEVVREQFNQQEVCDVWITEEEINEGNVECLPPMFALANDIEIPDSVVVPPGFVITDDMKLDSMFEETGEEGIPGMEIPNIEFDQVPNIEFDQATASDYNAILIILKVYVYIFVGVVIVLVPLFFLISPGTKAAMITLGVFDIICSIVAVILWKAPELYMSIMLSASATTEEEMAYMEKLIDIITSLLGEISGKGLKMALWIGIISVLTIVLAIILPKKKKNEETPKEDTKKEQPARESKSTK